MEKLDAFFLGFVQKMYYASTKNNLHLKEIASKKENFETTKEISI